jgi:hypothetical protein
MQELLHNIYYKRDLYYNKNGFAIYILTQN